MGDRRAAFAVIVAALSIPGVASAGDGDSRAHVAPVPAYDWTVTLGAEGREEPLFQGSSRERLRPYPIFAVRRYGTPEPFRGPRDGLDIAVIDEGNYQLGPVGQFVWSQRDKASFEAVRRLGERVLPSGRGTILESREWMALSPQNVLRAALAAFQAVDGLGDDQRIRDDADAFQRDELTELVGGRAAIDHHHIAILE